MPPLLPPKRALRSGMGAAWMDRRNRRSVCLLALRPPREDGIHIPNTRDPCVHVLDNP